MSIMMYMLRQMGKSPFSPRPIAVELVHRANSSEEKPMSNRLKEFKKKLQEDAPVEEFENFQVHPNQEQEPLERWPEDINPHTGEVGGPRGPEPTRYGDWERKGRCVDF